jgi:hypothetical protein
MDETVTLTMLPVCPCGQYIDVEVDLDTTTHDSGYRWLNVHFFPCQCPSCGAKITSLQMEGKYVEMFLKGFKK